MFAKTAEALRDYAKKFSMTPLEKKLNDAMSNENWGAPNSLLIELSQATSNFNDFFVITREVWAAIDEPPEKWRRIFKALALLEYLLKYGTDRMAEDARQRLPRIRSLMDFKFNEDGKERGSGVREKSALVMNMLNDQTFLAAERKKAKEGKDRFVGMASSGAVHSFGGYASAGSSAAPPAQPAAFSETVSTARLDNLRKAEAPAKPKMVDLLDLDFSPKKSAPSFEADFGDFGDFVSQAPAPKINAPSNPFDLMNSPVNKGKSSNPFAFSGL